jgi:4-oxalmesaconate hydratase
MDDAAESISPYASSARIVVIGAVRGKDPNTGEYFDDTVKYVDACQNLSERDRHNIFEGNARRVYPRLDAQLNKRGK